MLKRTHFAILLIVTTSSFAQIDSLDILPNLAENAYLEGDIPLASYHYQRALELESKSLEINASRFLKNAELLSLCLKETGQCETVVKYILPFLNNTEVREPLSRVIHQTIKCHAYHKSIMKKDIQSKVLTYFNLEEIDVAAHIQLADFLNGAYSEEKEFDDFFYLIEYGYSPALKSLEEVKKSNQRARQRLIIASTTGILSLGMGFLLWSIQRQKKHLTKEKIALLTGKEKETSRLSVDLHDILGYKIIELKGKTSKIDTYSPESKAEIMQGLDELHKSMRYIVQANLTPESLKFGLAPALDTLFNRVIELGTVRFELYKHGLDQRLDPSKEKHIFYIIQELVSNVIKHSKAEKATFEISQLKKELVIIAEDNGIGYSPSIETLKTVKARTDFLNGKVIEDAQLDKGSTIIINIPIS